jgi:hypothetical protein
VENPSPLPPVFLPKNLSFLAHLTGEGETASALQPLLDVLKKIFKFFVDIYVMSR